MQEITMNAAEQVKNFRLVSKMAALVNLLKVKFPGAIADLEPWLNDPATRQCLSSESIDFALHLPHKHSALGCSTLLIEIHFDGSITNTESRVIGVEIRGFEHQEFQWHFSTVNDCRFTGTTKFAPDARDLMKTVYKSVLNLFAPVDLQRQVWFM
jgi:hypothetical protein